MSWPEARWSSLALAASLAICAVVAAALMWPYRTQPHIGSSERVDMPPLQMEMDSITAADPEPGTAVAQSDENPFLAVEANPVSTFPLRLGTRSYAALRHHLRSGVRPPREAVRIEEMINHFTYDYPAPEGDRAFAINIDAVTCPWQPSHRLVRIGLRGREQSAGGLIASDAAIQVKFDAAQVASYRLIGYETRSPGPQPSMEQQPPPPADIVAGYTTTALYEVVPVATESGNATAANPLLTATLSHRPPGIGSIQVVEASFSGDATDFSQAPADFRFAAAVAQFGMILRGSPHRGSATLVSVADWARASQGADLGGQRAEFIALVQQAQAIAF